jgi:hypothetical protein
MTTSQLPDAYKEQIRLFDRTKITSLYCGFVDVLGFGTATLRDHSAAMDLYERLLADAEFMSVLRDTVRMNVYSDSFILVSANPGDLLLTIQLLQPQILRLGHLVRGGVAFGPHAESDKPRAGVVVSSALTKAVQLEKTVKWPCVALHPELEIPDHVWFTKRVPTSGLLFFDGLRIVSPFNELWFKSAKGWAEHLMSKYPEHTEKYEWFLRLYAAVKERRETLVPPDVLERHRASDGSRAVGAVPSDQS